MTKIGLGTVQFGLDYGISNTGGKTPYPEIEGILFKAGQLGVRVLDTAALYGISEEVLGKALPAHHSFDIVTKTPRFDGVPITKTHAGELENTFWGSLERLRQSTVYGLLAHDADNLLTKGGNLLMDKMLELRDRGLVKKVGASVYNGQQIDHLMEYYDFDIIQLPINILDQRLLTGGHLSKLRGKGVEIHARSVFMQGLLLMEPDNLPPYFGKIKSHLNEYHRFIAERGLSPVEAALGFVTGIEEVDKVICGVNNIPQFEEICQAAKKIVGNRLFQSFALEDESILNPSQWKV